MASGIVAARPVLLAAGLAALVGCGGGEGGGPKTSPVRGKVVVKNGDVEKLTGWYVRLESLTDPSVKAVGEIEEGGEFVLGTVVNDKPVGGAPEGEYRAWLEPPRGAEGGAGARAVHPRYLDPNTSKLKYTIRPGENTLTVEVERPK